MAKKNRQNKYQSQTFGNKPKEQIKTGSLPVQPAMEDPKPEETKMTVEAVEKSETQAEFDANKARLIREMKEEAESFRQKTVEAKAAYDTAQKEKEAKDQELEKVKSDLGAKEAELSELSGRVETARKDVEKAETEAQQKRDNAEKEAAGILSAAAADAAKRRAAADSDARKAVEEVAQELDDRGRTLDEEKKNIEKDKKKLKGEQDLFELQKIELEASRESLNKQKEVFSKANPTRLESLERDLETEKERYNQLLGEYQDQRQKYIEIQTKLDSVRAEVEDPESGKKEYALRDLLDEIRELKDELAQKSARLEKYPNGEKILELENQAESAVRFEEELNKTQHQRDEYRQRYEAERNLNSELTSTKRELDATRALNEHLLQELEKNKTALENRTGNVCPALTNVDEEANSEDFRTSIADKKKKEKVKDLKELVELIYHYAGNGNAKEFLYYEKDDIRSFLAGMAVSQLIILKGMSGTGKSSMPRIISKAISGNHSLIPVESSWRDRNELLGYYNDFNKLFNAKKFTIELYRSGKAEEIPTFIVLDEMNLARIEYYFSDFLAILEEPDKDNKWLVELVSSDMRTLPYELPESVEAELRKTENKDAYELWNRKKQLRAGNMKIAALSAEEENILRTQLAKLNALIGAKDLIDGRKMRIPQNVWFVGTANEDESTFEISDKVYDRAQVIVLNKKAVRGSKYDPKYIEHYISNADLHGLYSDAIKAFKKEKEVQDRLEAIDNILIDKFHVSFGNRIIDQAKKYAAVFTAADGSLEKALDFQISTKILRKVYSSDDADAFSALLKVCGDYEITSEEITRKIERLGR